MVSEESSFRPILHIGLLMFVFERKNKWAKNVREKKLTKRRSKGDTHASSEIQHMAHNRTAWIVGMTEVQSIRKTNRPLLVVHPVDKGAVFGRYGKGGDTRHAIGIGMACRGGWCRDWLGW